MGANQSTPPLKRVVMTKRIEGNDVETIISELPTQRSKLACGQFISHPSTIQEGYLLHGGTSEELMDTRVVSVAKSSLIITVLLEGRLSFGYDDLCFDLEASVQPKAVVVNLTKPVSFRRDIIKQPCLKKLNVLVSHQWLESRLGANSEALKAFLTTHKGTMDITCSDELVALANRLVATQQSMKTVETIAQDIDALTLIHSVVRDIESFTQSSSLSHEERPDTMAPLIQHIEYNLDKDLGLDHLAKMMAMSVSKLQKEFKRQLGMTVVGYVRARKLERAKQSILQTGLSITEAAYEAGYQHPSNFTLAFRKHFGHCPAELVANQNSA
ncbi:transcriptional regulator VCA0231 ortholog [Vibrio maritimus]|uniref:Transcriptional regulator VCA0231 ortholog n=1 Tax=Vibrio maritimus TaxID=990268 RepID=A0A090S6H9_9VIBR|nr:transcriptional regulator VCA0231 ortholog [Vibrio maritimus]